MTIPVSEPVGVSQLLLVDEGAAESVGGVLMFTVMASFDEQPLVVPVTVYTVAVVGATLMLSVVSVVLQT